MTMQRDLLKQYLRASPSRRFDVAFFSSKLPKDSPPGAFLFANAFLNSCILFKYVDINQRRTSQDGRLIGTLIYLPYDHHKPAEGGESIIFCEKNLQRLCEYRRSGNIIDSGTLAADVEKLKALDALPTFSPFIVELAFERAGLGIPESYLQLTPEVRAKLTAHLMGRLRPLVVVAYHRTSANIEKAVEELTAKLFCLRETNDVLPLIEALRLQPEIAQEVLNAWMGIAYFEYEYASLQPKLKEFAHWMAHHAHSADPLKRRDRASTTSVVSSIRQKIRLDWNEIVVISTQYRESYDAMAFRGNLEPFVSFLKSARASYWRMGEVLGGLELMVAIWRQYTRRVGESRLPYSLLSEMLGALRDLIVANRSADIPGAGVSSRTTARI